MVLSGETGIGKSYLIKHFEEICDDKNNTIPKISIESQAPIGKFNVSNIRPLYPFSQIIEMLLSNKHLSAKAKLTKNLVMTVLASIPVIDSVFYAVKEISKDLEEYKKEQTGSSNTNWSETSKNYYKVICKYTEKTPLVIFIDDMQWTDSQSVELLNLFASTISSLPLMFVVGLRKLEIESQALPMLSFYNKNYGQNENVTFCELDIFSKNDISLLAQKTVANYSKNNDFEDWIEEHSYGVPGVVDEYLKYFKENPPFAADGKLNINLSGNEFIPASVQSLFSDHLSKLSEDDRNILSICSTEGREFTASVVAELLNTNVLEAIKKLKAIQNRTGIIKSIGAQKRYGVKTTIYKFNQAYYQSYFENLLEYEEYTSLHGEIAVYLKEKYNNSKLDDVKNSIVPFLAAHSIESEDDGTAKEMLVQSAKIAKEFGNNEMIMQAYESYRKYAENDIDEVPTQKDIDNKEFLENLKNSISDLPIQSQHHSNGEQYVSNPEDMINFESVRLAIVNNYHLNNYDIAAQKALDYIENNQDLPTIESSQLYSMAAKAFIELQELDKAEKIIFKALELLNVKSEPQAEHFVLNTAAILYHDLGNMSKAFEYLEQAAQKAVNLPPELRLLTVSNISFILKNTQPAKSKRYYDAAVKLCESLDYKRFLRNLEELH